MVPKIFILRVIHKITFFKVVYRRHTNFAMENIQQSFTGDASFGKRVTAIVARNGDLINSAFLQVTLPSLSTNMVNISDIPTSPSPSPSPGGAGNVTLCWCNFVGLALIEYVTIEIGGQQIDKHYASWMYVWQELTMTSEKAEGYKRMVGGYDSGGFLLLSNGQVSQELHVPLDFWFNINAGLSLPLIALQYHEVRFIFQFMPQKQMLVLVDNTTGNHQSSDTWSLNATGTAKMNEVKIDLYIDYIYLDTDERRRFAQMSHEYLIEQIQVNGSSHNVHAGAYNLRLSFNHPCKELIFYFLRQDNAEENDFFNFSTAAPGLEVLGGDVLKEAVLKLNGHQRFTPGRGPLFFRQWQPFIHHTNIPQSNLYVYSFALRPEEHQPSGTCNFSRIDNAQLTYTINTQNQGPNNLLPSPVVEGTGFADPPSYNFIVYTRNYNVLRIMSGMGGLAYSN